MTAKITRINPCIMWNETTGDEEEVRTRKQYERLLAKGYVWLTDLDEDGEVARMASHYDIKTTPVSPRRQQAYRIPTTWGITVATLMQEVESDRPVCICNVCGKQVSSYLSFTDDNGLEVVVGKGCLKKCAKVEGVA